MPPAQFPWVLKDANYWSHGWPITVSRLQEAACVTSKTEAGKQRRQFSLGSSFGFGLCSFPSYNNVHGNLVPFVNLYPPLDAMHLGTSETIQTLSCIGLLLPQPLNNGRSFPSPSNNQI